MGEVWLLCHPSPQHPYSWGGTKAGGREASTSLQGSSNRLFMSCSSEMYLAASSLLWEDEEPDVEASRRRLKSCYQPCPGLSWGNMNHKELLHEQLMFSKCIYHAGCRSELGAASAVSCENGSCLVHCSFLVSALQGKISNHPNPMCTASCGAGLLLTPLCVFLFQGGRIPSLSSSSTMSWAWAGWRWR